MSRGSWILVSGAVLVLAAAAVFVLMPRLALPDDLLAATPEDAAGVVHVRVGRLVRSKAFDQLIKQRGHYAGVEEVQKLCAYDPVEHVDEALLFALSTGKRGLPEWGVLLKGDLDPRRLAECVKITLKKHGRTSQMRQEDVDDVPCVVSSQGDSRVCALSNGLIGGSDATVRAAIATVKQTRKSVRERGTLMALWNTLDASADARGVAFVPDDMRTLLRTLARPLLPASLVPLTQVTAGAGQFVAVDTLRGRLALETPTVKDAAAVSEAAQGLLRRLLDVPALALTPAGQLVRATKVSAEATQVRFTGDYPLHAVGTVLDLLPTARRLLQPGSPSALPPLRPATPAAQQGTSRLGPAPGSTGGSASSATGATATTGPADARGAKRNAGGTNAPSSP